MGTYSHKKRETGLTLVELVIVLVVVGIISAYALTRNSSASVYTLVSQAQTMASDIRHAQMLASSWGKSLRMTSVAGTDGTYSFSCVTSGAFPCNSSPVLNPATGQAFAVSLQRNVVLAGTSSMDIDTQGRPNVAASYVLSSGVNTATVTVAAITGFVIVAP